MKCCCSECLQLQEWRAHSDIHEPREEAGEDLGAPPGVQQHGGGFCPGVGAAGGGGALLQVPKRPPSRIHVPVRAASELQSMFTSLQSVGHLNVTAFVLTANS